MGERAHPSLAGLCLLLALPGCSDTQPAPVSDTRSDAPLLDAPRSDGPLVDAERLDGPPPPPDGPLPDSQSPLDGSPPPDGPAPDTTAYPSCGSWGNWTCVVAGQGCAASCKPAISMTCNLGLCTCIDPSRPAPVQCSPVTPDLDGCQQCALAFSNGCCNP